MHRTTPTLRPLTRSLLAAAILSATLAPLTMGACDSPDSALNTETDPPPLAWPRPPDDDPSGPPDVPPPGLAPPSNACTPARLTRFPFARSIVDVAELDDGYVFVGKSSTDDSTIAWRAGSLTASASNLVVKWVAIHDGLVGIKAAAVATDGDSIVVTGTLSGANGRQVHVVALDLDGKLQWEARPPASSPAVASGVAVVPSGIVVTGFHATNSFVWRLDHQGTVLWSSVLNKVTELSDPSQDPDSRRILAVSQGSLVMLDLGTGTPSVLRHGTQCQTSVVGTSETGWLLGGRWRGAALSRGCTVHVDPEMEVSAMVMTGPVGGDPEVVEVTAKDGKLRAIVVNDEAVTTQYTHLATRELDTTEFGADELCGDGWTPHTALLRSKGTLATGADSLGTFAAWVPAPGDFTSAIHR